MKVTTHEMLEINELLRMESTEVQKMQALLPMVADADLRQEIEACISTATHHTQALVKFCQANQLA
ncbi:MAG TPA: hypothetical protein VD973_28590 [Symbiobacteriaceae bacterium]|nr:hypothetical protein [Symbiobacteriaceae bacterium]